jgi:hypothetical protein
MVSNAAFLAEMLWAMAYTKVQNGILNRAWGATIVDTGGASFLLWTNDFLDDRVVEPKGETLLDGEASLIECLRRWLPTVGLKERDFGCDGGGGYTWCMLIGFVDPERPYGGCFDSEDAETTLAQLGTWLDGAYGRLGYRIEEGDDGDWRLHRPTRPSTEAAGELQ